MDEIAYRNDAIPVEVPAEVQQTIMFFAEAVLVFVAASTILLRSWALRRHHTALPGNHVVFLNLVLACHLLRLCVPWITPVGTLLYGVCHDMLCVLSTLLSVTAYTVVLYSVVVVVFSIQLLCATLASENGDESPSIAATPEIRNRLNQRRIGQQMGCCGRLLMATFCGRPVTAFKVLVGILFTFIWCSVLGMAGAKGIGWCHQHTYRSYVLIVLCVVSVLLGLAFLFSSAFVVWALGALKHYQRSQGRTPRATLSEALSESFLESLKHSTLCSSQLCVPSGGGITGGGVDMSTSRMSAWSLNSAASLTLTQAGLDAMDEEWPSFMGSPPPLLLPSPSRRGSSESSNDARGIGRYSRGPSCEKENSTTQNQFSADNNFQEVAIKHIRNGLWCMLMATLWCGPCFILRSLATWAVETKDKSIVSKHFIEYALLTEWLPTCGMLALYAAPAVRVLCPTSSGWWSCCRRRRDHYAREGLRIPGGNGRSISGSTQASSGDEPASAVRSGSQ